MHRLHFRRCYKCILTRRRSDERFLNEATRLLSLKAFDFAATGGGGFFAGVFVGSAGSAGAAFGAGGGTALVAEVGDATSGLLGSAAVSTGGA